MLQYLDSHLWPWMLQGLVLGCAAGLIANNAAGLLVAVLVGFVVHSAIVVSVSLLAQRQRDKSVNLTP